MAISGYMLIPVKAIASSIITCWVAKAQVNKIWKTIDNVNGSAIGRFKMVLFIAKYQVILFISYLNNTYGKLCLCLTLSWIFIWNKGDQIETFVRKDIWNLLSLNMEEGKLYILHNVSVLRNCANSHLANHEYKLAITRFSIVTSMGSETLSQLCCLKPIPLEVITESSEIPAYCIGIVVVLF